MKSRLILILAALLLFGFTGSAFAETFVVYDFQSGKALAADTQTMGKLLKADLAKLQKTRIANAPDSKCYRTGCAKKTLRKTGADAVVVGEIRHLGKQMYLFVSAVWADEIIEYEIPLDNVEEFGKISERLAISIRQKKRFESEMAMDSVTEKEEMPFVEKQTGDISIGFGIGAWMPLSGGYMDAGGIYSFSGQLKYEVADMGIELDLGYGFGSSGKHDLLIQEGFADISAMYYFTKKDRSPFIGGIFGVHAISLSERGEANDLGEGYRYWAPVLGAFAGYEFGRAQNFSFQFRLGYKASYLNMERFDVREYAHGPFLGIGINFF